MNILHMMAIAASAVLLMLVVELIRRGRLKERYSLLWLLAGAVMLLMSSWRGLLDFVSHLIGIYYPPSFLFLLAFLFLLLITMHFSVVISSLFESNKKLAQEVALLRRLLEERTGTQATAPSGEGGTIRT
jgi:hypothetical protein